MPDSLSDKLKALGVQIGARGIPRPQSPKRATAIESIIPGQVVATPFGETFVSETWYEQSYAHGQVQFTPALSMGILTQWGRVPHISDIGFHGLLFLDTETTGLGGGTGTIPFLVGLGHLTENGFHLVQLLMRTPQEEPAVLYLINRYVSQFAGIVTYNGKSFDIPILNTRHVLNGFTNPFEGMDHIDLLPLARRLWRNRLPSRSLGNLEVALLGVARTQEEVPGFMIPQIYFDYLHDGDATPLAGVMYHNAMDILSLAALFQYTAGLLEDPLNYTIPQSLDIVAIARLYEELGMLQPAIQLYESGLSMGMPEPIFLETLERYATLYRKRGEWERTVEIWQKAVEHHHVAACVELAKYYEHQCRECDQAMQWTERAIGMVEQFVSGAWTRREMLQELEHRRERLQRKLENQARRAGKAPD